MTEQSDEPRLSVDLDECTDTQLDDLVTVDLVNRVATLATLGEDNADRQALRQGIVAACSAYIDGLWDRQNQRSEKQDNEALERVTRNAQTLYDALLALQDYPGLEPRLEQSIRQNLHLHSPENGFDLSRTINKRRNIFRDFRELLVDLQVCAEDVINRQPKPTILEPIDDDENRAEGEGEGEGENKKGPIQLERNEELNALKQQWRARLKARRLPKDFALQKFLHAFRPTWEALTDHPFTEGMHYAETGETVSRLVDCVEAILRELAPGTQRTDIVTALRKTRVSASANLPS